MTYQSGNANTQIILLRKQHLKLTKDIKLIPSEECVTQHKLLICAIQLKTLKYKPNPFVPKLRKAAGPSEVVTEMLKAAGHVGAKLIADLGNSMIRNGDMPADWKGSFIINLYKGKGDALERGNYGGLKLLDHVMKVMKRVIVYQR